MRGNLHVPCGAGEKPEITSNAYLLLTIIESQMAGVMKKIISDGDLDVEIEGKKYYFTLMEKPETTVADDVKPIQN